MTKNEAMTIARDMIAEQFVTATRRGDIAQRDKWLACLNTMHAEWKWLRKTPYNIPILRDIPTEPGEAE